MSERMMSEQDVRVPAHAPVHTASPVFTLRALAGASGLWLLASIALAQTPAAEPSPANGAQSAAPKAASLSALLDQIEQDVATSEADQKKRVEEFDQKKQEQTVLLEKAKAAEAAAVAQSERLEAQFEENERRLKEQEELLKERMGSLGELFGVVRQVAGDTGALVHESIVSAQLPGRDEFLADLGQSKALPSLEELEKLWYALQQEMTEQGRVVRFEAQVTDAAGHEQTRMVTRVGTFNLVADGKYLSWLPETESLIELPRQPETRYVSLVGDLEHAKAGHVPFAIDPSRGSLLALLVQTPDLEERLEAGGYVGYTIIGLGLIAAVLGLLRLLYLLVVMMMVKSQMRSPQAPKKSNPLGRVLSVYQSGRELDVETLERKLDEAVLRESGAAERLIWMVKVASVVAPLLGLLGTVTGMIRTFQAIMLFGAGDPKLMAGGISEALVTTMLGLVAAVPLVLLHSVLRSTSRRMTDILQEQAAGVIAVQAERKPERAAQRPAAVSAELSPAEGA